MIDVKEKITHLMGALKKKVLQKITIISKKFNKKNENIQYHAVENNYVELYNDRSKFRFFRLIGRNWTKKPQLPVAICWGFNKWKHGFISDYVPDYKTAFASKKSMGIFAIYRIIFLDEKPKMFFIWGYTETFWVRLSAKILNIPISRIEDGFVRSAGLGAEHNTPYSLVIEKEALYYDSRSPSTLENILNHYDFSKDTLYEEQASKTIKLLIENNISKYNLSSATAPQTSLIKLRKKILVIGQVANDAAIRLGNPDKWTIEAIIKLAKEENIDADVLYRPHPEVYKKFQKNRLQTYKIKKYATIVDPEIPLDKFLKDIDHVYLISSLSGVEALIRGVKVTTLGVPFYAGWGLTDDRVYNIPRRDRKISLLQLVYCLYLKYPTYLADPDNGFDGLRITIMRIDADRHIKKLNALPLFDINQSNISKINDTLHLSTLLIQKKNSDFNIDIIRKLNFHTLFNRHYDTLYQKIILNLYFGLCLSDPARKILLSKIRTFIDKDIFNEFLLDIYTHGHKDLALENLAYLANHLQEYEVFDKIESQKSFYKTANMPQELLSNTLDENVIASSTLYAYENKNYNKVIANNLLLFREGIFSLNALNQLIGIAYMTFKNDVAIKLSELSCAINIMAQNRSALGYKIKSYSPTSLTTNINFQKDIIRHITLNSEQIAYALSLSKYFICEKDKEFFKKAFKSIILLDTENLSAKATAFIALNEPFKALEIMEYLIEVKPDKKNILLYSNVLTYTDQKETAFNFMKNMIKKNADTGYYKEFLRVCTLLGDYKTAITYLNDALNAKMILGDMTQRKIYFGSRQIHNAFKSFYVTRLANNFHKHYKDKELKKFNERHKSSIILFNIFGPGDEIRFASIYHFLKNSFENVTIGCEPRLLSLFQRSFKDVNFLPIKRIIRSGEDFNIDLYNKVPERGLCSALDNYALSHIENHDYAGLVTDFLQHAYKDYSDFSGKPFLKVDPDKVQKFTQQLKKHKTRLIGLSWRSSLTTHSRNEHYLTIQEIAPIFEIEGVTFVNFQYDECQEELDWIEENYPGKMINIEDVDQYNDFDSVAAMMKAMDLMISPATTVVELAGAIGCQTWLLSNSSELFWRKIDDKKTDVWCQNITHIEGDKVGDKVSLVKNLTQRLSLFSKKGAGQCQ